MIEVPKPVKDKLKRHSKSELIEMMFRQDMQYHKNLVFLTAALSELGGKLTLEPSLFQDELPSVEYKLEGEFITAQLEGEGEEQ